ncbi:thiol-activated cytolysin family protein [Bacteroides heparinolyticus]|uniref:thiol-activated cytolysin family protein n=1 Tax=Prevotella heparinolytica TaxID=28113 RepID=UPI0035A04AC0
MRHSFYLLLTVTFFLFSCENEELVNTNENLVNTKEKLAYETSSNPFLYDEIYQIRDGKEINLTHTQLLTRSTHEFYEIATIQPTYIYLGSTLTAESINKGRYVAVGFPNVLKPEITISFSLPIMSMVIAPKKSSFQNAITEAIGDKNFSGKQSQVFTYKMKQFSYYKEVKLAFGANVNVGQLFGINTEVNSGRICKNTALFVDFSQIYFNAAMDIPDDGNIFKDENTRQQYLSKKPIYVNSVNYGRKGVILVESKESYDKLSVAIRASFNAKVVNGKLSLDYETEKILQESDISICILGGDGGEAVKTIKGFNEFQEFIINGGVYTNTVFGVPISFSAAYASDNSMYISEFNI